MPWRDVGLTRMLTDWMLDVARRRHVAARVVETMVPATLLLWWPFGLVGAFALASVLTVAEWLWYEFVLEPYWWAGPYWERGPRDGETFTRW